MVNQSNSWLPLHFKLAIFLKKYSISWKKWSQANQFDYLFTICSEIPLGKCLGSSAAFNTVLATSLLIIFKQISMKELDHQTKDLINDISVLFESVEHGNPSGIDNFVSVHGGLILFNKTKNPKFKSLLNAS